jgi:hypothetical protein
MTNFPLATSRSWQGIIAFGFVAFLAAGRIRSSLWIPSMLGLALVLPAPILGSIRHAVDVNDIQETEISITSINNNLSSGDFDAYEMHLNTLAYSEYHAPSYGEHLMGGLLFFVPRAVWKAKPRASNLQILTQSWVSFTNLSQPLPSEGIVNFGIAGLILYAAVFSLILKRFDLEFRKSSQSSNLTLSTLLHGFGIGFIIVLMRGEFQQAMACMVGFSLSSLFVFAIVQRSERQKFILKTARV